MNRHIAALDRKLAQVGEPVLLRRPLGTSPQTFRDVTVKGLARGYAPNELVGGIIQGDSQVIVSPSEMIADGWPWPPKINDKVVYAGRMRNVQAVQVVSIGVDPVRIEMQVRG